MLSERNIIESIARNVMFWSTVFNWLASCTFRRLFFKLASQVTCPQSGNKILSQLQYKDKRENVFYDFSNRLKISDCCFLTS